MIPESRDPLASAQLRDRIEHAAVAAAADAAAETTKQAAAASAIRALRARRSRSMLAAALVVVAAALWFTALLPRHGDPSVAEVQRGLLLQASQLRGYAVQRRALPTDLATAGVVDPVYEYVPLDESRFELRTTVGRDTVAVRASLDSPMLEWRPGRGQR